MTSAKRSILLLLRVLKTRKDRRYFLVQHEGVDIGVIDFNDISATSATLGLYANPKLNQKGIGSLLMQSIVEYAFKRLKVQILKAEVFEENAKAKALYEKLDFAKKGVKWSMKKRICMELSHEHRSF